MAFPLVGPKSQGFRTFFGTWVAPGARVTFLGPAGVFEDTFTENNRVATLNAALARCRSGKGDTVFGLPGYSETIDIADFTSSLVAGVQLVGLAPFNSSLMPQLNFSTTVSTVVLDLPNVSVRGFRFVPLIDAVANFIAVTAAGCKVTDCVFECGTSSALDVTQPVIIAAGADSFEFANNRMFSLSTATHTAGIIFTGASTGVDIHDNDIELSANGVITVGAFAVAQARIRNNIIKNRRAAGGPLVFITDTAGSDGVISNNYFGSVADITVVGGTIAASGSSNHGWRAFQNFGHDENVGTALVGGIGTGTIE